MNSVCAANKSRSSDVLAEPLMVCPIKKEIKICLHVWTFFSRQFTLVLLTKDALNLS